MNPIVIEAHTKLVLLQWMIIIAAAWLFGRLAKRLGQPLAVGEITAGMTGPMLRRLLPPQLSITPSAPLGGSPWPRSKFSQQPHR